MAGKTETGQRQSGKRRLEKSLRRRLNGLKMLAFDFDGVFTDGKVFVDQEGREQVVCSRKDTLRLPELKKAGLRLLVVSQERNPVVARRCWKMRIECFQGVGDKLAFLKRLAARAGLGPEEVGYVGDDINDLPCLAYAGFAATVRDGDAKCKAAADYVTRRKGGDHAVREICDLILAERAA